MDKINHASKNNVPATRRRNNNDIPSIYNNDSEADTDTLPSDMSRIADPHSAVNHPIND